MKIGIIIEDIINYFKWYFNERFTDLRKFFSKDTLELISRNFRYLINYQNLTIVIIFLIIIRIFLGIDKYVLFLVLILSYIFRNTHKSFKSGRWKHWVREKRKKNITTKEK